MRTKCPCCGATASLDVLVTQDGAREALMAAFQMPAPLGKLMVQYIALFRPPKRDLSFDRVNTLLGELMPMIQAGQIERGGRAWVAPLAAWQNAIEQMLMTRDKLQLPLKGHGYLLEVIAGMGSRAEAVAETKREDARRHRSADAPVQPEKKQRGEPPPEFYAMVKRVTGKSIGGDKTQSFEESRRQQLEILNRNGER